MLLQPVVIVAVVFLAVKSDAGDLIETEQNKLERNLKILRKDFNEIIENVENFAADFLKQIREAGKLAEAAYMTEEDYNWRDEQTNTIEQITETSTTSIEPTTTSRSKTFLYQTKRVEEQEISNEIPTRRKRSTGPSGRFDNRQPAPTDFMGERQRQVAPIDENVLQGLMSPIADQEVMGERGEPENILGAQQVTKTDQPIIDAHKNYKEDQPICSTKTQKEINMDKQKLEELKGEVKKLNELVSLLKDQQKLIKAMDEEELLDLDKNGFDNESAAFLYKTLKQLDKNRRVQNKNIDSHSNSHNSNNQNLEELNKLKLDLKKTADNLNQTNEILIKEKEKEEIFEGELKRQNTELKFLKVMMESLYDKSRNYPEIKPTGKALRNSDFDDMDLNSILGAVHTPKPYPMMARREEPLYTDADRVFPNMRAAWGRLADHGEGGGKNANKQPTSSTNSPPKTEDEIFKEKLAKFFGEVHKEFASPSDPWRLFDVEFEKEVLANQTKSALIQMTKKEPVQFVKSNQDTRESNPSENRDTSNVHRLLSALGSKKNKDRNNPEVQTNRDHEENLQLVKNNDTFLSETAGRASKTDDLDFKLKLIDLLTNEEKADDSSNKEKKLNDAMKKLLQPEKKSDDNDATIEALMAFVKDQEPQKKPQKSDDELTLEALRALAKGSQPQKNNQNNLSQLLKKLNATPQSKTDDADIETELKQLQMAINSLKPKEDIGFSSLAINRRPKDDTQDFQSMLSQIIAQNGGSNLDALASTSTVNLAGAGSALDKNSLTPQLISQYLSPTNAALQSNINSNGYYNQQLSMQDLIKSYGSAQYGNTQPSLDALAGTSTMNLAGAGSALDKNSLTPQLISQYLSPTNAALQSNINNNGYYNQQLGIQDLIKSYGSAQYGNSQPSFGGATAYPLNSNAYGPNPNGYNPNLKGYNLNAYNGPNYGTIPNPYSSGLYNSNPNNPYSSNLNLYRPNSYNPGPNSNIYQENSNSYTNSQGNGYSNLPRPYSSSAPLSSNLFGTSLYNSGYQPLKPTYPIAGYQPGTHRPSKTGFGGVTTAQSYASVDLAPSAYSEADKGNYGTASAQEGSGAYGRPFFQSTDSTGGSYQGYNFGSKSYPGSSLEQPYGNIENSDQYKANMITELTQQIQKLENVITGLNTGYSQSADDKAAIAGLEQRIYELKGVINNLNKPSHPQTSYSAPPQPYQTNPQPYRQTQPTSLYSQSQASFSPPPPPTYGNTNQEHNQPNSYSPNPPSQPQQVQYAPPKSPSPSSYQGAQPNYDVNSPSQSSQTPGATYHQAAPQETPTHVSASYQAPSAQPSDSTVSYQPKESTRDDSRMSRFGHTEMGWGNGEDKSERRRRKRQGFPPMAVRPEERADISIGLGPQAEYNLGDDALTQIANTFQKYLEENLTQSQTGREQLTNQQNRNSALEGLQQKLDTLKTQLESQKPSDRSLHNFYSPPGIYGRSPASPIYNNNGYEIQKTTTNKHKDIFTEIVIKIVEKIFNSLPEVLSRLFGNLVTSVGDSYGDYYSPLQNILKNLGPIGYVPLIFVKLLESAGTILQHLKKNPLFRQFLLPALVLGLVAGAILFLIYFLQQQEPYGYVSYQGGNNDYPQYEPNNNYGNRYDSITGTKYRDNSFNMQNYGPNLVMPVDGNFYGNNRFSGNNYGSNNPMQYSRSYYDYSRDGLNKISSTTGNR